MTRTPKGVRVRIFAAIAIALLLLLGASVLGLYELQRRRLRNELSLSFASLQRLFRQELKDRGEMLNTLLGFLEHDEALQKAWLAKDREALLACALPVFNRVRAKHGVTRFYLVDPSRVCFLRAHQPARHGDYIDRFTMAEAERTAEPRCGIELGPLGVFTLRAVRPWRINGKPVGYLELGTEIDEISRRLSADLEVESVLLTSKSFVKRAQWEEGMKMLGRPADWERLPERVIVDSSTNIVPKCLVRRLASGGRLRPGDVFYVSDAGRKFGCGALDLVEAGGRRVGCLVAFRDVTDAATGLRRQCWQAAGACAVVGCALLAFFYAYLGRVERGIAESRNSLEREIEVRAHAEQALRAERDYSARIINGTPAVICGIAPDGATTSINPAGERITGYRSEDIVGRNWWRVFYPGDEYSQVEHLFRDFEGGNVVDYEMTLTARDGTRRTISWNSINRVEENGEIVEIVGFGNDVTERRRAEESLRQAKERAEEANRQLEGAIERANRMAVEAEAANMAKSRFLANMSHEIRTPMNAIIGMTALILDTPLNPEQREYAELVRASGNALLGLINDILDFSKIEAGKIEFENIGFDVRTCVEEVGDLLAQRAHDKGLELIIMVRPDTPVCVNGDPGRLRQALVNLVNNAVKFTAEGEVVLDVSSAGVEGSWATLQCRVTDTGIGIPADRLDTLFRSFTQADASTTRVYGGTGLGLAITRSLVEMMGGRIGVESQAGVGSTFHFTVKLKLAESAEPPPLAPDLKGARILIVDDNDTCRLALRDTLRLWGCVTDEAADGPGALAMLRAKAGGTEAYQIAILDLNMPGMDGDEVASRIKADPAISGTRLMLLTSSPAKGDGRRARETGYEAYLMKPVKRSHLHDAICAVLGRGYEPGATRPRPLITRHTLSEATRSRARILVVEDNVVNQKVAIGMLNRMGYRCEVAANGLEALDALRRMSYDLVLMDCQMPDMDGYDATREIRKLEGESQRTPIVAMTAEAMRGDRERCLAAGMDDYLTKPIEPDALEEMLDKFFLDAGAADARTQPDEAQDETPPVDVEGLHDATDGDKELERELIHFFVEDQSERVASAEEACANQDMESLRRQAHAMRGSSANMGATRLAEVALEIEQAARDSRAGDCAVLLEDLKREWAAARDFFSARLSGT